MVSCEEIVEKFVSDIAGVKRGGKILIVSGELCCDVYNHPKVDEVLQKVFEKGATLEVVAGPVISVSSEKGRNRFFDYEDKIKFFCSKIRSLKHYRIIPSESETILYAESPHPPAADPEVRTPTEINSEEQEFWVRKLKEDFDYWLKNNLIWPARRDNFLFLTIQQIRKIMEKTEMRSKSYQFMNKEEIEEFGREVGVLRD